jgi:hypothetical protein
MREDQTESNPIMPEKSKYAGQLVDVSSRRSIEILSSENATSTMDLSINHLTVNHFYHEGQFWRAVFPLNGVDEIYGQVFNFSKPKTKSGTQGSEIVFDKHGLPKRSIPILNHLQSRFKLKSSHTIDLYPMNDDYTGDPLYQLDDFVYTSEAVGPKGIKFNIRDGLAGNLVNSHRFMSTQEMVFERVVMQNQFVTESPPLPVNDSQKRTLMLESVLRSHRAGMSERYFLFRFFGTNNCTSSPFQILDRVIEYSFLNRVGAMLYRLPLSPRFYLWVRGLDKDPLVRKLVRHEFDAYIHDSTTQERKRLEKVKRSRT